MSSSTYLVHVASGDTLPLVTDPLSVSVPKLFYLTSGDVGLYCASGSNQWSKSSSQVSGNVVAGSTHSFQSLSGDLTLAANAGKPTDTSFFAGVMGNLFGDSLTRPANYLGGVIGMYSVTGAGASTYPKGAVIAGIGDGSTDADGAVVAWIDGDSAPPTNAGAAFKVRNRNSTASSGFNYGIDLSSVASDGFLAVAYKKGEARLSNGQEIYTGPATTRNDVRTQVGTQGAVGSFYLSSAGKAYLKVAIAGADTDWQLVTTTAAD